MDRREFLHRGGIALLGAYGLLQLPRAGNVLRQNHPFPRALQSSSRSILPPVRFQEETGAVTFGNQDGDWTIWLEHSTDPNTGAVVGPGYIGRFIRQNGIVIVNDFSSNNRRVNNPSLGGLGCFGIQLARKNEFYPDGDVYRFTWDLTERMNANQGAGLGVTVTRVLDGPRIDRQGNGILVIENELSDIYSYPAPILGVRRTYLVDASSAKCITTITMLWDGAGPPLFVKEPKLVAHGLGTTDAGSPQYRYLEVFDIYGKRLNRFDLWKLPDPMIKTRQIRHKDRFRLRFHDGRQYFNVIMAATNGKMVVPWMNAPDGPDRWAQNANAAKGLVEASAAYCLQGERAIPDGVRTLSRNWEATRWASGKAGSPPDPERPQVGVMGHFWEGGRGYPACLEASRPMESAGTSYSVWTCYSYDTGWQAGYSE